MDSQVIINIAFTIIGILGGFILNTIFRKLEVLQRTDEGIARDMTELKVALPSNYVHKEDFKHLTDVLFEKLDRIESKLDKKVDK